LEAHIKNIQKQSLSPDDYNNKIRNRWLLLLCIITAADWFTRITDSITEAPNQSSILPNIIYISVLKASIFSLNYHYIYKKRGTKLLLFNFIMSPLLLTLNILAELESGADVIEVLFGTGAVILIFAYYYIVSYKMYRINAQYHREKAAQNIVKH
jgi:hypothetical protein